MALNTSCYYSIIIKKDDNKHFETFDVNVFTV